MVKDSEAGLGERKNSELAEMPVSSLSLRNVELNLQASSGNEDTNKMGFRKTGQF